MSLVSTSMSQLINSGHEGAALSVGQSILPYYRVGIDPESGQEIWTVRLINAHVNYIHISVKIDEIYHYHAATHQQSPPISTSAVVGLFFKPENFAWEGDLSQIIFIDRGFTSFPHQTTFPSSRDLLFTGLIDDKRVYDFYFEDELFFNIGDDLIFFIALCEGITSQYDVLHCRYSLNASYRADFTQS